MAKLNIGERVLGMNEFQTHYQNVLLNSIMEVLPNLESANDNKQGAVNWKRILSFASLLTIGETNEALDVALRISQHCISSANTTYQEKVASAILLEKLTNKRAIKLAINRDLLPEDFRDEIPLPLRLESFKRDIEHSIVTSSGEVVFLNKFQNNVYEKHLEADVLSISAPTSAGKSFILYTIIIDKLSEPGKKHIVYLVPSRALINQVENDLRKRLYEAHLNVYVSSVPQAPDIEDLNKSKIFVFTQERLHWFRSESSKTPIDFLIVDEAQKIQNGTRGILLQQKIEEVLIAFPNLKLFFSSPFVDNPEMLMNDLASNKNGDSIKTEFVAVNQNLFFLEQEFRKPKKWKIHLQTRTHEFKLGHVNLPLKAGSSARKKLAFLALTLGGDQGGNIIYANTQSMAEDIAILLYEGLEGIGSTKDKSVIELIKFAGLNIHSNYKLCKVLSRKIAFHYGNMPPIVRHEIERLFSEGKLDYLVCTSTLLEGVNLPAKSIFIRDPRRGTNNPMSQSDFWNLAGRAGRWGKEFSGNIFCIEPLRWVNIPSAEKKKQVITKAVDIFKKVEKREELLSFIRNNTPRDKAKENEELENAFGYFYIKFLREELIVKHDAPDDLGAVLEREFLQIKPNIDIPDDIVFKNPGISVIAQQNLLNFFRSRKQNIDFLIPVNPRISRSAYHYQPIIKIIHEYLSGDFTYENYCLYRAILVVNWMRGYPLSRLISDSITYFKSNDSKKSIDSIIRGTMKSVEDYARFQFAKFSGCYIDILRVYLKEIGEENLLEKIPKLNIWLEFGVSEQTQISLISLGLSRSTAIIIAEKIPNSDLDRNQVKDWIDQNYESLSVSPIIKEEIDRII